MLRLRPPSPPLPLGQPQPSKAGAAVNGGGGSKIITAIVVLGAVSEIASLLLDLRKEQ